VRALLSAAKDHAHQDLAPLSFLAHLPQPYQPINRRRHNYHFFYHRRRCANHYCDGGTIGRAARCLDR